MIVKLMITSSLLVLLAVSFSKAQSSRLNEIRNLFKEHNDEFESWPGFEIKGLGEDYTHMFFYHDQAENYWLK